MSRKLLHTYLSDLGEVDIATNGKEALSAVIMAYDDNQHYNLICLDIMMAEVDGIHALKKIRQIENEQGVNQGKRSKIIMTTALSDKDSVVASAQANCDAYIIKPVTKSRLYDEIRKFGFNVPDQ